MSDRDILIVGGYGEVGRRIARLLGSSNPGRVVLAGRHPPSESEYRTRYIDADDPTTLGPALEGVGTVVACVRQRAPHLLQAVARSGLAYTSIAPPWMPWDSLQGLRSDAAKSGARIVLAAGLEPGISSVLARIGADRVGDVDAIETALLLGVGDAYGADSMAFIVEEIAMTYAIHVDGIPETVHAFERPKRVVFPEPVGTRRAYTMPFRDQLYYPFTLGAKTAIARLSLDPPWLGAALAKLVRIGGRGLATREGGRSTLHSLSERLRHAYSALDRFALVVEVRGRRGVVRSTLIGRGQADATAIGAAAVAQALHADEVTSPGVFLPEEVIAPGRFLERLAAGALQPDIVEE